MLESTEKLISDPMDDKEETICNSNMKIQPGTKDVSITSNTHILWANSVDTNVVEKDQLC